MQNNNCQHENFKSTVGVARLAEIEDGPVTHFCAEIFIQCADCGEKFQFHGLPIGYSPYSPTVSLDGFELNVPIMPQGDKIPKDLPGYSININVEEDANH